MAYDGAFSRAEFPLTPEFAKQSANSTVGLSGKAVVFQDLGKYDGPYYGCDSRVRSEFCLPILNNDSEILGIIDAGLVSSLVFSDDDVDIYLTYWTNWTFVFEWFTVIFLLFQAIQFQRSASDRTRSFLEKLSRLTAVMFEMALPVAFLVPIAYWSLLGCTAHCYWADWASQPYPSLTQSLNPSDELPTGIAHTTTSSDSSYFYCAKSACQSWSTFLVHLINGVLFVTELILNNVRFMPSHSLFVFLHFIIWLAIAIIYQAGSGESIYGWITSFDTPGTVTGFGFGVAILVISSHQLWVVASWFCRRNRRRWGAKLAKRQRTTRPELEGNERRDKEYSDSESESSESDQDEEKEDRSHSASSAGSSSRFTSEIEVKVKKDKKKRKQKSSSASSSDWNAQETSDDEDAIQTN